MKVFVAGSTGAIGKSLVPHLLETGHEVVALARTSRKARELEVFGASVAVAEALNRVALTAAIRRAEPEVIIHQLTALTGVGNFKKFDEEFSLTNRFRTEVTDTMLAAARLVGARRFIAQSFCGWPFAREGGPVKTEEDPLDVTPPASFSGTLMAIRTSRRLCAAPWMSGLLRCDMGFSTDQGRGSPATGRSSADSSASADSPSSVTARAYWSFIHVGDVARATGAAMSRGASGIYNIVDDEPSPVSTWLPFLAHTLGAKPPRKLPLWLGKLAIGEGGVSMMTTIRGGSNAKAKREFGWQPGYPTWRRGFVEGLGQPQAA